MTRHVVILKSRSQGITWLIKHWLEEEISMMRTIPIWGSAIMEKQTELLSEINFGKHKGRKFIDVARNSPKYIEWAIDAGAIELSEETLDWFTELVRNLKRSGDY